MILGLSVQSFTLLHVIISVVGILAGLVVLAGMISQARPADWWTSLFLITTILTSVTGFFFPNSTLTPGQIIGALSLIVLLLALIALYFGHLAGHWRWIYVVSTIVALYFNCFVLVVQAFQKIGFLQRLVPTQTEPPFAIAQAALLVAFVVAGVLAVRRFQPAVL